MKVNVDNENGIVMVRPSGKLDALTAPVLQESLDRILEEGSLRLVIDMTEVRYVSSAGLRVFIRVGRQLMQTGKMSVTGLHASVRQVFEMAGFHLIMTICDDVNSAKAAV
jgi:anti-anti-sigma factor